MYCGRILCARHIPLGCTVHRKSARRHPERTPQDFVEPDMSVLKITGMSNHFAFRFDSESGSALEVMERKRMHGNPEVAKRIAADIHQSLFRGRILETDRIVGTRHLPFENLSQLFRRTGGMKYDFIRWQVQGSKERQPLNVVPVKMCQQEM